MEVVIALASEDNRGHCLTIASGDARKASGNLSLQPIHKSKSKAQHWIYKDEMICVADCMDYVLMAVELEDGVHVFVRPVDYDESALKLNSRWKLSCGARGTIASMSNKSSVLTWHRGLLLLAPKGDDKGKAEEDAGHQEWLVDRPAVAQTGNYCTDEAGQLSVVECVLEWERKGIIGGFSSTKLLPTDPDPWTNENFIPSVPCDQLELPEVSGDEEAWYWADEWKISADSALTDPDGWEYGWNVTAAKWSPKDATGMWVRRRKWTRTRLRVMKEEQPSPPSLKGVASKLMRKTTPETGLHGAGIKAGPIDLTFLQVLYTCRAGRNKRQVAKLLGLTHVDLIMISFNTPHEFFIHWAQHFQSSSTRSLEIVTKGAVIVIYDLSDALILASILHPLITHSGEYAFASRDENQKETFSRFWDKFAVVVPGWSGSNILDIPEIETERSVIPALNLSIVELE